jgi:polar amino acid transport system substrate-binding protein
LLIGTEYGFYPFADVDDEGVPQGFSVDLFRAVAREMEINFEFRIGSWKEILSAIKDKQIDVIHFVKYTQGRDNFLDFSIPHTIETAITINRHDGLSIKSLQELNGKEVVVMEADGTHLYLAEHISEARLFLVPSVSDALQSLAAGSHDYAVIPRTVGLVRIRDLNLQNLLQLTGPFMEAFARGFSFGVQEGDQKTLAILNQGLNLVKESGEYDQIYHRWFGGIDPRGSAETMKRRLLYSALGVIFAALIAAIWLMTLRRVVVQRTEESRRRREATEAAEAIRSCRKKSMSWQPTITPLRIISRPH